MAKLVSKVYGDALFELAMEENKLDETWDEARAISQALDENPDFLPTLKHPDISMEQKLSIIKKAFSGMSADTLGFLDVLVKKGRIGELKSVLDYFDARAKEAKKIGVVTVTTPIELSSEYKKKVENRVLEVTEYASLEMKYIIDKSLLGGMVIRIGDQVLDSSIRSQIDAMRMRLADVRL
ncbi:MAG: ATP synthase F1 subunit delta [Eubacterium sp.]|nr:ATP synthase F1 subunit delta [Eubacterium sp.]